MLNSNMLTTREYVVHFLTGGITMSPQKDIEPTIELVTSDFSEFSSPCSPQGGSSECMPDSSPDPDDDEDD